MFAKAPTHHSEAWKRAVASLPCVVCMREDRTQAAHPNHRGKGMQMKAPDCWCVPLCVECHREFDQGMQFGDKHDKRVLFDEWIILTLLSLASKGLVKA